MPAGLNFPNTMKLSFAEKIPFIVDKHKNDGDEAKIKISDEIMHKKK